MKSNNGCSVLRDDPWRTLPIQNATRDDADIKPPQATKLLLIPNLRMKLVN